MVVKVRENDNLEFGRHSEEIVSLGQHIKGIAGVGVGWIAGDAVQHLYFLIKDVADLKADFEAVNEP